MRGGAKEVRGVRASAFFLVITMFFSIFVAFAPTVSANVSGNLALVEGLEPKPGATYDKISSAIYPVVKIQNQYSAPHNSRKVVWEICPGDFVAAEACPSSPPSPSGENWSSNLLPWENYSMTFTNQMPFQPSTIGIHTIVFSFDVNDQDSSDDKLVYSFNVVDPLRDLVLNSVDFDESVIYNSNVSYPISGDFTRISWESGVNATFGWDLLDNGVVISSSYETITPPIASAQHWSIQFPDVIAPYPGNYELSVGLFSSSGDMNDWNNRIIVTFIVNDSVDAWIESIVPARGYGHTIDVNGQNMALFALGDDSVRINVGNLGNLAFNSSILFTIFDMNDTLLDGPNFCNILLDPGESTHCIFSMPVTGELKLRAEFGAFSQGDDINPSDNWYEVNVSSRHMSSSPSVSNPPEGQRFDSGDIINFIGQVSQYAAQPVNYTWRLNFEEHIGYGRFVNTTLPMGEWMVSLTVRDSQGMIESSVRQIRIQNRVQLQFDPWVVSGEAVMDEDVDYIFNEPGYPPEGYQYQVLDEAGISPLRTIDLDFVPTQSGIVDPAVLVSDIWINLSDILPTSLPRESLMVYRIPSIEYAHLEEFEWPNYYEIISTNDTLHIFDDDFTNGLYMIAGDLDLPNVTVLNLTTIQLPNGGLTLEWEPSGELDNPYFGGWRIYRRTTYPYYWPYVNYSQFNSVIGTEIIDLDPYANSWADPVLLPDDTCVSYLVMALDRQYNPDYSHGAAAGWNGLNVDWQCGDAVAPRTEVLNFNHLVSFDNSSGQNIHNVNITWTWPDYGEEDNLTWHLYRLENIPSDLTWATPLQTDMWGEPGTQGSFYEIEEPFLGAIKKDRTYYYILVPIDDVGNVDFTPLQGNIETVDVENQFWDHNSYLIPEPPEEDPPPYGNEWLGELLDYWDLSAFKTTATVAFAILLLNIVMVPVVIQQTRGVRRRIKRHKLRIKREKELAMADDMADELEDIFN